MPTVAVKSGGNLNPELPFQSNVLMNQVKMARGERKEALTEHSPSRPPTWRFENAMLSMKIGSPATLTPRIGRPDPPGQTSIGVGGNADEGSAGTLPKFGGSGRGCRCGLRNPVSCRWSTAPDLPVAEIATPPPFLPLLLKQASTASISSTGGIVDPEFVMVDTGVEVIGFVPGQQSLIALVDGVVDRTDQVKGSGCVMSSARRWWSAQAEDDGRGLRCSTRMWR